MQRVIQLPGMQQKKPGNAHLELKKSRAEDRGQEQANERTLPERPENARGKAKRHSKEIKEVCRQYCSRISKETMVTIVESVKKENLTGKVTKEVLEWIRKRGSKEK